VASGKGGIENPAMVDSEDEEDEEDEGRTRDEGAPFLPDGGCEPSTTEA